MNPRIILPRFTFLCGAPDHGQYQLAAALHSQDHSIEVLDLEEPLRDAVTMFAFGQWNQNFDLDKVEDRQSPLLVNVTYEGWMEKLDDMNTDLLGPAYQAALALKRMEINGSFDVFERFVFRDAEKREDVQYFIDKFGVDNCLQIHCGSLPAKVEGTKFVWLATPTLENRLEQLRKELSDV